MVADIAAAVAAAAATLNRYPDREFAELRDGAGGLPRHTGGTASPEQVWAANGSNEVMLQLLQAFGGPGRTALSFAPTYSMYPEYARDTMTEWVVGHRETTSRSTSTRARDLVEERRPSVVLLPVAEQPDRHGAAARGGRDAVRGRRRRASSSSTRRTASSAGPARRARSSCCPSTATWSSPAR